VINFIGLGIGLIAILLSSVKKTSTASNNEKPSTFVYFLPLLVFLGGGMVDVLINITNTLFLPKAYSGLFPLFAFSVAAIAGFIVLCYRLICKNEKITLKNCFAGVVLGIPNYLSIFFLLKALQDFNNNGAVIFPILNIAVILVTASVALLVLKEKLTPYNYIGLGLAVLSLGLILAT